MPIVTWPDLLDGCSEALLKRRQAKSAFNFATRRRGAVRGARGARRAGVRAVRRRRARRARRSSTSGSRAQERRRSAPPRSSIAARSAFVSRRHGATSIDSRPFLDLVGPGPDHRAADDHHRLIQPAVRDTSGRRAIGSSGSASFWSDSVYGSKPGSSRTCGRRVDVARASSTSVAPDEHLGASAQRPRPRGRRGARSACAAARRPGRPTSARARPWSCRGTRRAGAR